MSQTFGDQNYIYLYDLPKDNVTSTQIAQIFEEKANTTLTDGKPQIRRDLTRPFYSGIVQMKDAQKFNEAAEAMRYFQINGKWCRALKFDKQLLGSNKEKLQNHNVFVRTINTSWNHPDLHKKFEQYGKIKSLKISNNADHTSRGYGFICFQEEGSAAAAVAGSANDSDAIAIKFEIKQARSILSLINNVYVKNIPQSMTDTEVRALFSPYGEIESLVLNNDPNIKNYQFGFVCYNDPNKVAGTQRAASNGKPEFKGQPVNKEYGPQCAQKAIEALHGRKMDDNLQLYVRAAMKKCDRETEKVRDTLRYKTSKKRCNLYVKNFPNEWGEEKLKEIFEQFGETEKGGIKVQKTGTSNVFAFVCFKTPDAAAAAKQTLHNQNFEGKTMMINHYEIKELRNLQKEEAMDKSGFEQYMASKTGGFHLNDLITHPHMTQILQQLLEIMQTNEAMNTHFHHQERQMRGGHGGRGGYNNNRGNYQNRGGHHQGGNYNNHQQNQGQNMGGHQGGMPNPQGMQQQQNRMPQAQQQPGMPGMPSMPGAPQQQMTGGMPGMPGAPAQANTANMSPQQRYFASCQRLLPSVQERNPLLKDQVGQAIFEYVNMMVAPERAPKITGMLIELPVDQIKQYMQSLDALKHKVDEATVLIDNAEKQGQM